MLAGKLESNLSGTNPTVDSPAFATALMDGVDQLERGDHAPGRVAIVAAAGADAIEPVLHEQKALLATVAGRLVFRSDERFFQRVPLWLRTMDFEHSGRAFASGIPVNPALATANGPATFADPPRMPIAAEERGDGATGQVQNRNAAVFDLRIHRPVHAGASCDADDRLACHVQQRIEPMAGQPTEETAAAGGRIEQIM